MEIFLVIFAIVIFIIAATGLKIVRPWEKGLIERLKLELPDKKIFQAPPGATCIQMKKNNLSLTLQSLEREIYEVVVPEEIRLKAKAALERMLEYS